jgi:hypothetical protein
VIAFLVLILGIRDAPFSVLNLADVPRLANGRTIVSGRRSGCCPSCCDETTTFGSTWTGPLALPISP